MRKEYVVRKTTMDERVYYLHPEIGFCDEKCNGGNPYRFPSKQAAGEALRFAMKYRWGYLDAGQNETITYDEYLAERNRRHDEIEEYAKEQGVDAHRAWNRLYLYLTTSRFGKQEIGWHDVTFEEMDYIEKLVYASNRLYGKEQ